MSKLSTQLSELNNSVIIIPRYCVNFILKEKDKLKGFFNIKLIDEDDFISSIFYKYDDEAIIYLMNNYGYNYFKATSYLNAISQLIVENLESQMELINLRNILIEKNLLVKEPHLFYEMLHGKSVYYLSKSKSLDTALNYYHINAQRLEFLVSKKEQLVYYEFDNIDLELSYVFNEISQKIDSKVDIDTIKIFCRNSNYNYYLLRMARFFNINITFNNELLSDYYLIKRFLNNLQTKDFNFLLNDYLDKYTSPLDQQALLKLDSLVSPCYRSLPLYDLLTITKYLVEKTSFKTSHYHSCVEVISDVVFDNDLIIYLLSFDTSVPSLIFKSDILSDNDLRVLGLDDSGGKNSSNSYLYQEFIASSSLIHLGVTKFLAGSVVNPSLLIPLLNIKKSNISIKPPYYSLSFLRYYALFLEDRVRLYHNEEEKATYLKLKRLISHVEPYENKFEPFPLNIENKNLSYSTLNTYFSCPFSYYLNYILLPTKMEKSFMTSLGTFVHSTITSVVTSKATMEEVDAMFERYISDNKDIIGAKEQILLVRIKDQVILYLKKIKQTILSNENLVSIKDEKSIIIDLPGDWKMKGLIDLLFTIKTPKNDSHLVILDLKTGNSDIVSSFKNVKYGVHLQLLAYIVLLASIAPKEEIIASLLAPVFPKKAYKENIEANYYDYYLKSTLFHGYFQEDDGKLASFTAKENIKFPSKIEEYAYNMSGSGKVGTFNWINESILKLVLEFQKGIVSSNFSISPLVQKLAKTDACLYCTFKDICYRRKNDIRGEAICH
jgi:hypothetical protein